MPERETLNVGDRVFYVLEDFATGEEVIHESTIKKINYHDLEIGDQKITKPFYYVTDGVGMQRNALYTIKDLFAIAEWAKEVHYSLYEK